jgi:hypothetical protein
LLNPVLYQLPRRILSMFCAHKQNSQTCIPMRNLAENPFSCVKYI